MQTSAISMADELSATAHWDDAPPPRFEEEELDILAFDLWQRANLPGLEGDEERLGEEEALRGHASCL
jgi:hypothetical protein